MSHTSSSSITLLHRLLLLALALSSSSLGADITLSSVADFTDFVNDVNTGTSYSGTTIYLGSDITLSESINPIGNASSNYFLGVFDGQGYVISNLTITPSSTYVGLFGYSQGLTIKNVVLDSSCSITSKLSGKSNVFIGGIIGECIAKSNHCGIENNVNMADVTFSGSISNNLCFGGTVGYLYHSSSSYDAYVKNSVNYGSVTDSGAVNDDYNAYLGGIVGYSEGSSTSYSYIQNCLNYGIITHSGTSTKFAVGGILGYGTSYTRIENCVSAGKITTNQESDCIGSIVGSVGSNIYIKYCYYTNDVGTNKINGTGTPSSTTGTPDTSTTVDLDLVNKLNSNATSRNWSKWAMLYLNGGSINNLAQDLLIGIQGHIPNPVKEGNSFLFWCKDAECTEKFDPETESISGNATLYAGWASGTVTFDFDNGTAVDETFSYNTEIIYPNNIPEKEGHTLSWDNYHELMPARDITVTAQWTPINYTVTFDFDNETTVNETFSYNTEIIYPDIKKEGYILSWDNYHELMPARDITVTAQWTPNNYTVTFDANGGSVSETSKTVTFNEKYGDLPEPNRVGFIFFGWFTNETNGTGITNKTTVTTPDNHTLYAHWEEVTTQVEIVFNSKDLTKEEITNIIEQYTKTDFTIVKYEKESGKIRVIIGFSNDEQAENFIGNIKGSSEMKKIINIGFITDDTGSFSTMIYPLTFFNTLFL